MRDLADALLDARRDAYLRALREGQKTKGERKALADANKAATTADLRAWRNAKRRAGVRGLIASLFGGKAAG